MWEQYKRIIKSNAAIVLFADGVFTSNLMQSNIEWWRYNLVWDRQKGSDFMNSKRKPLKSHEDICIFYKSQPTYNPQMWESTPYHRNANKKTSLIWNSTNDKGSHSDGLRYPLSVLSFGRERFLHPNQKPVPLLEWLIKTYTNKGEIVFDSCCGSGSTLLAAKNTERKFIGFELEKEYYEIAQKRLGIFP